MQEVQPTAVPDIEAVGNTNEGDASSSTEDINNNYDSNDAATKVPVMPASVLELDIDLLLDTDAPDL
jgi:hypothetical protein